jgi:hypothetical protein
MCASARLSANKSSAGQQEEDLAKVMFEDRERRSRRAGAIV